MKISYPIHLCAQMQITALTDVDQIPILLLFIFFVTKHTCMNIFCSFKNKR